VNPSRFPHVSLSKKATKTRLTEDFKKNLKNIPKKKEFFK
jgi:hypothetical protein